jgi:hypothetical protein
MHAKSTHLAKLGGYAQDELHPPFWIGEVMHVMQGALISVTTNHLYASVDIG